MRSVTKSAFLLVVVTLLLSISPIAKASPGANIRVIPIGGVHTGEPIVTKSPAELMLYSTAAEPIEDVWLVLVINEDTYTHLNTITADTTIFNKADFMIPAESKIPPEAPSGPYPGCEISAQYEVNAAKDKLDTPVNGTIYYAYKSFSIDPITTIVQTFITTVDAPGVSNMMVLVLVNGNFGRHPYTRPLNEKTPWSGSTLIVPECCGTIFLAVASFAAFGIFRRRSKK